MCEVGRDSGQEEEQHHQKVYKGVQRCRTNITTVIFAVVGTETEELLIFFSRDAVFFISKPFESLTRLLVYQGKALNVPTAPYSLSNSFWVKKY